MVKLKSSSVDLLRLSNVVKNEVVKQTVYHELVWNVNAIHVIDNITLV